MKTITCIGGGTGISTLLLGLKKYNCKLNAIVTMTDSGGSSGKLRKELGVLPPGDVRQCLLALASVNKKINELFCYRFDKGSLKGHNFGNLFFAALEKINGDLVKAIDFTKRFLSVGGNVIPVTLVKTQLCVLLKNNKLICGEDKITKSKLLLRHGVKKFFLKPRAWAYKDALLAIEKADYLIFGPGNLYSSIIPNLLVSGIRKAIRQSKAKKIYICNLMTQAGQTDGFKVSHFVEVMEQYLGKGTLNFVICNKKRPSSEILRHCRKEGRYVGFVEADFENFKDYIRYIPANLLSNRIVQKNLADPLASMRSLVRHDSDKLAQVISDIVNIKK